MNSLYERLLPYLEKRMALRTALALLEWDMETLAPEGGMERTSHAVGVLHDTYRVATLEPEVEQIITALLSSGDLTREQRAIAEKVKEDIEDLKRIPADEYRAYAELQASAASIWAKARSGNDFSLFAPTLKKMVGYARKFAGYKAKEGQALYDALLEEYEKGFSMKELDRFFAILKEEIRPLLEGAAKRTDQVDDHFLYGHFTVEKQREFSGFLLDYLGFDKSRGVLAESAHPFTTHLHKDDVRLTTHYDPGNVTSAIFSTIHECGHALYEQGVADEISQTPVGQGASCGMHESQSRFYENVLGRSEAFWKPIFSRLAELFPEQLGIVELPRFIQAINQARPGLIRIESDELTYCLHIMVRYELEKELIGGTIEVEALPEKWAGLYEEYLGIHPRSDAEGVLQDIHWALGSFGYFPSYALGNAFAAQLAHKLAEDYDLEELLASGNLSIITDWMREKIHRFGSSRTTRELLRDATGEDFDPKYYVEYLKAKFGR